MKEVYCKDCKHHYKSDIIMSRALDLCSFRITRRDFFGNEYYEQCCTKNKGMNCQDYKKKWYKFWIKEVV